LGLLEGFGRVAVRVEQPAGGLSFLVRTSIMLKKEICRLCCETEAGRPLPSFCTVTRRVKKKSKSIIESVKNRFDRNWAGGEVLCLTGHGKKGPMIFVENINKAPPKSCPYWLEHRMEEE